MVNPRKYCIGKIKGNIPDAILKLVFEKRDLRLSGINMESEIDLKVMTSLLEDINLLGGIHMRIPLNRCIKIYRSDIEETYEVPSKLLGNKNIVSVSSLVSGTAYVNPLLGVGNSLLDKAAQLIDSDTYTGLPSITDVELIATNTINVSNANTMLIGDYFFNVTVEHSNSLSTISAAQLLQLSQLATIAAKKYIYVNAIIDVEKGAIFGGQSIDTIRNLIETYSDAGEQYDDFILNKWRKLSNINNKHLRKKLIRLAV